MIMVLSSCVPWLKLTSQLNPAWSLRIDLAQLEITKQWLVLQLLGFFSSVTYISFIADTYTAAVPICTFSGHKLVAFPFPFSQLVPETLPDRLGRHAWHQ